MRPWHAAVDHVKQRFAKFHDVATTLSRGPRAILAAAGAARGRPPLGPLPSHTSRPCAREALPCSARRPLAAARSVVDLDLALVQHLDDAGGEGDEDLVHEACVVGAVVLGALVGRTPEAHAKRQVLVSHL